MSRSCIISHLGEFLGASQRNGRLFSYVSSAARSPVHQNRRLIQSSSAQSPKKGRGLLAFAVLGGAAVGAAYGLKQLQDEKKIKVANPGSNLQSLLVEQPPKERVARRIGLPFDDTGLKLVLYQYQPCPFCTKVRAFLDYYGFNYEVVEVNPVLRSEVKWSGYKKVPILIAQVDGGYQQLVDSTLIISILRSLVHDRSLTLEDLVKFYPMVEFLDDDGKRKLEIMNKYFLMLQDGLPEGRSKEDVAEERKWRRWVDDTLVHQLSPNVYRTWDESLQAFRYFSASGDWENIFPEWQRLMVVYVGAAAMYFIGKRLKKRHNLRDDVRQSLYEEVNIWLRALSRKGTPFMGGSAPDLSDLGVYACLNSIEGCNAFQDLLTNTKVRSWYERMRNAVGNKEGRNIFQKVK